MAVTSLILLKRPAAATVHWQLAPTAAQGIDEHDELLAGCYEQHARQRLMHDELLGGCYERHAWQRLMDECLGSFATWSNATVLNEPKRHDLIRRDVCKGEHRQLASVPAISCPVRCWPMTAQLQKEVPKRIAPLLCWQCLH